MRHKPVELHKDSQKVQACGLTLSQITVVPGPARELHAQQLKFSKSSSFGNLLLCIEFGIPTRERRARKQCISKCWAKWQVASKHDIKTKHSKHLMCEGYLKERTLQELLISLNTLIVLTYNDMNVVFSQIPKPCHPLETVQHPGAGPFVANLFWPYKQQLQETGPPYHFVLGQIIVQRVPKTLRVQILKYWACISSFKDRPPKSPQQLFWTVDTDEFCHTVVKLPWWAALGDIAKSKVERQWETDSHAKDMKRITKSSASFLTGFFSLKHGPKKAVEKQHYTESLQEFLASLAD